MLRALMRPDRAARPEYVAAFREIMTRIAGALADLPRSALPVRMYVAGGAALHLYTGERVSRDIDAAFSRRVALPENLEVSYRDADGAAQLLYFDRQYSDTFGLLHEDAYDDSVPLVLEGVDSRVEGINRPALGYWFLSNQLRYPKRIRRGVLPEAGELRICQTLVSANSVSREECRRDRRKQCAGRAYGSFRGACYGGEL